MITFGHVPARNALGAYARTLREAHIVVSNARGNLAGPLPDQVSRGYLSGMEDAIRILSTSMPNEQLRALFFTQHFYTIASMPMPGYTINRLVSFELDRLLEHLELVKASVERQEVFWAQTSALFLLDTNYWTAEHRDFEMLDFCSVVGTEAEQMTVVVPFVVVDELDDLKTTGGGGRGGEKERTKTRTRARAALRFIESHVGAPGCPSSVQNPSAHGALTVAVVGDEPGHQRLPNNDDEIVARAETITRLVGRPVTLVGYDQTGFRLRARAAGLPSTTPTIPSPGAGM